MLNISIDCVSQTELYGVLKRNDPNLMTEVDRTAINISNWTSTKINNRQPLGLLWMEYIA